MSLGNRITLGAIHKPMPSKKGYLPPQDINPLATRCVTFYIPDELWWLAAFWGQMSALADPFMWEGTDSQRHEITQIWEGVLSSARANFDAGECEMTLEFRVVGGIVEFRPYPTAGWTSIGEACPCAPPIPQPQYNPDVTTTEELACNIAVGVIEWLMTKYNDTLDAISAAATTAAAFDAIFFIFPPAYIIADIILDAIHEIVSASLTVARAYDTVERREDMQQWLYCEMASTGEMTSEIWSDFKQAFIDGEFGGISPGRSAMYPYLQSFEEDAILARARIESYGSGNCVAFACGFDWEHTFDFETEGSLLGWYANPGHNLPTVDTDGLRATQHFSDPDARRGFFMRHELTYADSTTRIVSMAASVSEVSTGDGDGDNLVNATRTIQAAGTIIDNPGSQPGTPEPDGLWSLDFNPDQTYESTDLIRWFMQVAQKHYSETVTGDGLMAYIRVRGNGKNPFVP